MIHHITQGRNIRIQGKADKKLVDISLPKHIAVTVPEMAGLRPRVVVKEGAEVKVGTAILQDKDNEKLCVGSPASGKIAAVNRGDKRALLSVVIECDGKQEAEAFRQYSEKEIESLEEDDVISALLSAGLWPVVRQRPFSKIARPDNKPKAIFIHAMNTEPLAGDLDFILEGKQKEFQAGLNILRKLTGGKTYLCISDEAASPTLTKANGVEIHRFSGPHPAGNVSTHIHTIDPINKGDVVWYIEAQDVLRVAHLFLKGEYSAERIVAVTGVGAKNRVYAKTYVGAPLSALLQGSELEGMRCISGSILTGRNVGRDGYLGFYDSQVSVIPEGGHRELLGWMMPGVSKYTFSKTFLSAFLPEKDFALDTDTHGGHRAIVLNHLYDKLVPLDILTYFLMKAVISGEIEEAEKLGILECAAEDFALCTFACPSKTDVGGIIQSGLDLIEREG